MSSSSSDAAADACCDWLALPADGRTRCSCCAARCFCNSCCLRSSCCCSSLFLIASRWSSMMSAALVLPLELPPAVVCSKKIKCETANCFKYWCDFLVWMIKDSSSVGRNCTLKFSVQPPILRQRGTYLPLTPFLSWYITPKKCKCIICWWINRLT